MRVPEKNKNTTTADQIQMREQPFFNKRGKNGFFSTLNGAAAPFFEVNNIQTKLTIGQSGDTYEKEADVMADQVVQKLNKTPNYTPHNSKVNNVVQRQCSTCEEEEKIQKKEEISEETPMIHAKSENSQYLASPDIQSRLSATKGKGNPLSSEMQISMGNAFGADFSNVRIHTDHEAVQMNKDMGAQAFTSGNDIYFNKGKYDTNSNSGRHLLAHELTHTIQQKNQIQTKHIQKSPDKEKNSFAILVSFPFKKLKISISVGDSVKKLLVPFIIWKEDVSEERAKEIALNQSPEFLKTWDTKISEAEIERGFINVQVYLSAKEFIDTHLSDTVDEDMLPSGVREGSEERTNRFNKFSSKVKKDINKETNRRYWDKTGLKDEKIKKGEKGKADVWLHMRDTVIAEQEFMQYLPEKVKRFLNFKTGNKKFTLKEYTQLMRIARSILEMSDTEMSDYLSENLKPTSDLNIFEKSINDFLEGVRGSKGKGDDNKGGKKGDDDDNKGGKKADDDNKGKKKGSKYGRLGLLDIPQPIITVLEFAAEVLGDPQEAIDLMDLIVELTLLSDITKDITNVLKDPENLILIALGLIDYPAISNIDNWVFEEDKKTKKSKGKLGKKQKGLKGILAKVRKLLPVIKKVLKPVFLARRNAKGVQFRAALLIDKMPAKSMSALLDLAKQKDDKKLSSGIESFAKELSTNIVTDLTKIPTALSKLEPTGSVDLINKEDLGKIVAKAVIKLAGGVYGKIAGKVGVDDVIADIAKHGTKYTIPDALVDGINDNLNLILNKFKPLIKESSAEVLKVFDGIDSIISKELIPGIETIISPKSKGFTSEIKDDPSDFMNTISNSQGQNLSEEMQSEMEPHFGKDVQKVKIHTDKNAQDANNQINARAFTLNNNIYFGTNQYDPTTLEGKHLLSHELTHVSQHKANNESNLVNRVKTKSVRQRLVKRITQNVLKGTGLTKQSILGTRFIDYGYRDKYGRPRGIIARLKKPLKEGSSASGHIRPPGFKSGPFGHARCHLLGNQLGGSGKNRDNLVTCFQTINNKKMRPLENAVAEAVNKGEVVIYKVIPIYKSKKSKIPRQIHIVAKGSKGLRIDTKITNRR